MTTHLLFDDQVEVLVSLPGAAKREAGSVLTLGGRVSDVARAAGGERHGPFTRRAHGPPPEKVLATAAAPDCQCPVGAAGVAKGSLEKKTPRLH